MNNNTAENQFTEKTNSKNSNQLLDCGLPLFFQLANPDDIGVQAPQNRIGLAARTYVRSLTLMQKEAFVVSETSGMVWRLCSDEGPYLNGHDYAPCPLAFLTTGMVSAYMNEILALAKQRDIKINDIKLIQDNYYAMEGSLPLGTMTGSALPIELEVIIDSSANDIDVKKLIFDAIAASPLDGLMRKSLDSFFSLTLNQTEIDLNKAKHTAGEKVSDLHENDQTLKSMPFFDGQDNLLKKMEDVKNLKGVKLDAGSSFKSNQSRQLHVRGTCTLREDGVKEIVQELFNPPGSSFKFLSDEAPQHGHRGLAPDAITYISAGIGFCYMTQLGRYAAILRKPLDEYRIVQDTHFTLGGASGGTGVVGDADPIETHVYLKTGHGEDFARTAVDMGEQTCYLHAFCRTELKTKIKISIAEH